VDVNEAIRMALARFADRIAERHVQIDIASDLPGVLGHETWVEQVFANLIGNAIKYIGRDNTAPHIVIGGQREGEMVHIWVRDNGLGLAPEQTERVFDMFSRFHKDEASGTGLGLAIVRRAVHRMGGHVWVDSPGPGLGSTFHILLPMAPSDAEGDERMDASS
ncbi:MAG: HAMP domain-containing histidine kinase, partial [Anaerolineae bacterium]|nr:HAMP domain-containing histidine kinase [Anaerolineae bacterium]